MQGNTVTRRILLLFGNEPNPLHIERMQVLQKSGRYEPLLLYWQRGESSITLPFSSGTFPANSFIPMHLPDPRGPVWRRAILSLVFTLKLSIAMRKLKPDIVHPINVEMLGFAILASIGLKNIAIAYDFQDQIGNDLNKIYRTIYRWLLKKANVTFVHFYGYKDFLKKNGLHKAAIPIVDVTTGPLGWPQTRKIHNREEIVVGYYGYIRGAEQIRALVQAAESVNKTGRKVILDFAGCGDNEAMVELFSEKSSFIKFVGAFDYSKTYKKMFFGADVIFAVYPLSVEFFNCFARRFCEAVVSGTPVLVAAGSHMGKFVRENGGGWEVKDNSVEEMASVLTRICDDRTLLESAVLKKKRDIFRFETYSRGYLEALDKIGGNRHYANNNQPVEA